MFLTISINTRDRSEMIDITSKVEEELNKSGLKDGVCFVFVPHTTAGITINEKLGTWQGIFFCEFDGPRSRKIYIKFQ
jgi:thiamine phosphate synthase YjbQ (UPF0047 family)